MELEKLRRPKVVVAGCAGYLSAARILLDGGESRAALRSRDFSLPGGAGSIRTYANHF